MQSQANKQRALIGAGQRSKWRSRQHADTTCVAFQL